MSNKSKLAVAEITSAAENLLGYEAAAGQYATVRVMVLGSEGEVLANYDAPVIALREFTEVARDGVVEGDTMLAEVEAIIECLETGDPSKLPPGVEIEVGDANGGVVYSSDKSELVE